ncbi:tripartite motif-containing protein 30A-like [Peromyscus leucopus]|uniref:tripartite motif-containing protein 30A-like n=1 Tax=Peromyscus leucopus TaxID=10041 RepID=UPI0010A139C1|nr:tripartite motif-containing protein 30A-like [Peromyscus leucopus]
MGFSCMASKGSSPTKHTAYSATIPLPQGKVQAAMQEERANQKRYDEWEDDLRKERTFRKCKVSSDEDRVQMEFKGLQEFLDSKEKNELQKLKQEEEDIMNSLARSQRKLVKQRRSVRALISALEHQLQCPAMEMLQGGNSVLTRSQTLRLKRPDMVPGKQRMIFRTPDLKGMLQVFQGLMDAQKYWVHVTLYQGHNKNVVINEDKKEIQHGNGFRRNLQISETYDFGVLGYPPFYSGKHYWEVDVSRNDAWLLGLNDGERAQPQLCAGNENGIKVQYNPDAKQHVNYQPKYGYWVIGMKNGSVYNAFQECSVTHNASVLVLSLTGRPSRIGVFLDREACTLSFYDVSNHGVLIYRFYEPSFPDEVYPYFNPMSCSEPMTVCGPPS